MFLLVATRPQVAAQASVIKDAWASPVTECSNTIPGAMPCPPPPPAFTDGRCNQEADQSVAVYPDGKGGYNFSL